MKYYLVLEAMYSQTPIQRYPHCAPKKVGGEKFPVIEYLGEPTVALYGGLTLPISST
jgi:hypothetical protein